LFKTAFQYFDRLLEPCIKIWWFLVNSGKFFWLFKSQKALRFRAFHFSITEFWLYTATLKERLTTTIPLQKVILSTKD
jgi:hypothetical protein